MPPSSRLLLAALLLPLLLTGGGQSLAEQPPASDVPDTRQRLKRIYDEQGIWGGPQEQKKRRWSSGCGGGQTRAREPGQPLALPSMPAWLGYTILGIIVAGMLIPLIWMLRNSYADSAASKNKDQQAPEDEQQQDGEGPRPPWRVDLSTCRALLQQGRLAEAFAALHRLTLLSLERLQALTLSETTTNWEYVRGLVGQPRVVEALAAVTLAAEQSILGQTPPGAERYHELEQLVQARLQEAREAEERA